MESNKQQTPITPESLKGIGFEEIGNKLQLIVNSDVDIYYLIQKKCFMIYLKGCIVDLFFDNIEQIQEWLKPFQTTVAEEVR